MHAGTCSAKDISEEEVAIEAIRSTNAAVQAIETSSASPTDLPNSKAKLIDIVMHGLSTTSHLVMKEAERRGWKAEILDYEKDLIVLLPPNTEPRSLCGHNGAILFRLGTSELNTGLGLMISIDKMLTYTIGNYIGLPMPATMLHTPDREGYDQELLAFLHKHQRIVVKPTDRSSGDGVTTNVTDEKSLRVAIKHALKFSPNIQIQAYVAGDDYRLLVLNGHVIAATRRRPPLVIGDGIKTIRQLVELENANPWRSKQENTPLRQIDLAEVTAYIGADRLDSIPACGCEVQLLGVPNLSRGGDAYDVTSSIHPSFCELAEKIVNAAQLVLCGVDMLINGDFTKPNDSDCQAVIIEINVTPGLKMHHFPTAGGYARNVSGAILDEIIRRRARAASTTTVSGSKAMIRSQLSDRVPTTTMFEATDDIQNVAEIIPDPEVFAPLSDGERAYYDQQKRMTSRP